MSSATKALTGTGRLRRFDFEIAEDTLLSVNDPGRFSFFVPRHWDFQSPRDDQTVAKSVVLGEQ